MALVVLVAFLRNGIGLTPTNADALSMVFALAAGEMTETELALWITRHSRNG